jgi:hypothetical protein
LYPPTPPSQVLNSPCRQHDHGASVSDTLRSHLLHSCPPPAAPHLPPPGRPPLHPCLCLLARAVGFSDDVARRFKRRAEIHLVGTRQGARDATGSGGGAGGGGSGVSGCGACGPQGSSYGRARSESSPQLPLVMAVVVEDEKGQLQVFSRGQPGMVLSRCASVWDGESIRPLTDQERKQLHACNASMAGSRCLEAVRDRIWTASHHPPPTLLWHHCACPHNLAFVVWREADASRRCGIAAGQTHTRPLRPCLCDPHHHSLPDPCYPPRARLLPPVSLVGCSHSILGSLPSSFKPAVFVPSHFGLPFPFRRRSPFRTLPFRPSSGGYFRTTTLRLRWWC